MSEEATERDHLSQYSDIIISDGDMRNSTEKAATGASISQSKDDGKTLPHYLRAPTGSCHDFCKYGRMHSFRLRGKRHTIPIIAGSGKTPEKEQNRVKILSLAERRKKSSVRQQASRHQEAPLYDKHEVCQKESPPVKTIELAEESEINNQNTLLEKTGLPDEYEITECSSPSPSNESFGGHESSKEGTAFGEIVLCDETTIQEVSPLLKKNKACGNSRTATSKNLSSRKIGSALVPPSTEQMPISSRTHSSSFQSKTTQKVPSPVKKAISPGKSEVSNQEAPLPLKRFDASAGPALSGKSKATPPKSMSLNLTKGTTNRRGESNRIKNVGLSVPGENHTLKPLSDSPSTQLPLNRVPNSTTRKLKNTKSSSIVKHPREVNNTELVNDEVGEKTLYVIEPESAKDKNFGTAHVKRSNGQQYFSSPSSSSAVSSSPSVLVLGEQCPELESAFSKACDPVLEPGQAKMNKASQTIDKKIRRKVAVVQSEDKGPTPHSFKFKKEKTIDTELVSDGTRRIRVREGRRINDTQSCKGKVGKSVKIKESACADLNHPRPEAQTVVLKHQDVKDKRDIHGSFRRRPAVQPEDKVPTPYKLNFKRGKVVNPESVNDGPRRTRLGQGRRVGDNQSGKGAVGRRSFKKSKESAGRCNPGTETQIVVLRHQEIQDKKDVQGLFNDVIEETANKLVETKKSKVKALVGAFETVISLQESKPAASV